MPAVGKKIVEKSIMALRAREAARKAPGLTRRKTALEVSSLPGSLPTAQSKTRNWPELFVWWRRFGRRLCQARAGAALPGDPAAQGKILNVEKARLDKILSNEVITPVVTALGTGIGEGI